MTYYEQKKIDYWVYLLDHHWAMFFLIMYFHICSVPYCRMFTVVVVLIVFLLLFGVFLPIMVCTPQTCQLKQILSSGNVKIDSKLKDKIVMVILFLNYAVKIISKSQKFFPWKKVRRNDKLCFYHL
jgi:uncharacterized membrane protein YjgN (DUF898 family)